MGYSRFIGLSLFARRRTGRYQPEPVRFPVGIDNGKDPAQCIHAHSDETLLRLSIAILADQGTRVEEHDLRVLQVDAVLETVRAFFAGS
jgi:hypothetical protein